MKKPSRLRGLKDLLQAAVNQGSLQVEKLQKETAARPFTMLKLFPGLKEPIAGIQAIHDLSVSGVHGAIRLVNRGVGAALEVAIDAAEEGRRAAHPTKS